MPICAGPTSAKPICAGPDLSGADLTSADLSGAALIGANLTDANLTDANLSGANLAAANLTDAIMIDIHFDETTRWPYGFDSYAINDSLICSQSSSTAFQDEHPMLYTLEQVLANRKPLITVRYDASLLDAFRLLIERRVGQLPVVDENGHLKGIVAQQTILGIYFLTDGKISLFDLTVADCRNRRIHSPCKMICSAPWTNCAIAAFTPSSSLTRPARGHPHRQGYVGLFPLPVRGHPAGRTHRKLIFSGRLAAMFPDEASDNKALIDAFGPSKQKRPYPAPTRRA